MTYDAIVLGLGAMGSAAAWSLSARGLRVLGIEQFELGHERGSSHGHTRIIRKAYFEHPDYIPLLHRAYELWGELERAAARTLFHRVGLLLCGDEHSALIAGVRRAAEIHELGLDALTPDEIASRFPGFVAGAAQVGLFEADAGYLLVEDCVRAMAAQAAARGATLITGRPVEDWHVEGDEVVVRSGGDVHRGRRLILCAGSWTARCAHDLGLPLTVRRKIQLWFACGDERYSLASGFPAFAFEDDTGFFYGFPEIVPGQIKIAEHTGGDIVADADQIDRELRESDPVRVQRFVERHLPGVSPTVVRHSACMYTMTPDGHFIVDRHPRHPQVTLAAGFSGHGFKFAPLIGEALADLTTHGTTELPIGFLALKRFRATRTDT